MKKLIALAGFAALLLAAACDPTDGPENKDKVEVNATHLAGTWEGGLEHDFAQGYPQQWRFKFEGDQYTSWHTHQTAGSINDDEQGLKTVGNKEKGTWTYENGQLILTPSEQYASYAITSMSPTKYSYYEYNTETMEAVQWYETSSAVIESGIERDIQDGTDWYIHKYPVVSLTKKALSIKINKDTFVLEKK